MISNAIKVLPKGIINSQGQFDISAILPHNKEVVIHLKEGLKGINAMIDFSISHDLFNDLPKNSILKVKSKRKKKAGQKLEFIQEIKDLLLERLSSDNEYYRRVILEGFSRMFVQTQSENSDFIL